MATVAVDRWHQPQQWHIPAQSRPRSQYAERQLQPPPSPEAPLPPRNEIELNRDMLLTILTHFSTLIPSHFDGLPVRLIIHGGACMLLHPGLYNLAQQQHRLSSSSPSNSPHNSLPRRTATRDVDYINRSFAEEWHRSGISDATERLRDCIRSTARMFHLGADWMNSDADVALPMANDPSGKPYDPIHAASIQPNNVHLHTIFTSPNGMLTLVSVTPFWAVALKLVRYTKWDPGDICLLLRNGTNLSGTQWSPQMLENWLLTQCWPMGYSSYDARRVGEMRSRILHAIEMVSSWGTVTKIGNEARADAAMGGSADGPGWTNRNSAFFPPPPALAQHDAGGWANTSHGHAPPPAARPDVSRNVSPDLDDQWVNPLPRPKSHRPSSNQSPWHAKPETNAVQAFDRSISTMLYTPRRAVVPSGAVMNGNDTLVAHSSRRKRDKQRDRNRNKDRLSKLFMFGRHYEEYDSNSDSDGDDDFPRHSRIQQEYDSPQQQVPRPSAWNIYAQPTHTRSQSLTPLSVNSPSVQPSKVSKHRHRHRPPSLDLSSMEKLDLYQPREQFDVTDTQGFYQ